MSKASPEELFRRAAEAEGGMPVSAGIRASPPPVLGRDPDETTDLEQLITEVVPDAETWKQTPNAVLGGKRPIDLLHTPQEQVLRDLLRAAKHGMSS